MNLQGLTSRKWFYPLVYIVLIVLSMWPPYTHIPYDPRNTQDVILSILKVSTQPYAAWGWVLHVATLGVIALVVFRSKVAGRVMGRRLRPAVRMALTRCSKRDWRAMATPAAMQRGVRNDSAISSRWLAYAEGFSPPLST